MRPEGLALNKKDLPLATEGTAFQVEGCVLPLLHKTGKLAVQMATPASVTGAAAELVCKRLAGN